MRGNPGGTRTVERDQNNVESQLHGICAAIQKPTFRIFDATKENYQETAFAPECLATLNCDVFLLPRSSTI